MPPRIPGTIFTVVMENRHYSEIIRPFGPSYTNWLAGQYASAENYYDAMIHPSLPNYIWMSAGQNFGILDNNPPADHHIASTSHLANQLEAAGLSWRTYQESMEEPCQLTRSSSGLYAPKHNPFIYYDDISGWDGTQFTRPKRCRDHVVDYTQFDVDRKAGTLPRYVFITPNNVNNSHDGSIQEGDEWLAREIPKILSSTAFTKGGVLFLTYDEGSFQTDQIPMIVASPYAKPGHISSVRYDHSSFLRTVQRLLGLEELPCSANPDEVATMDDLFQGNLLAP